jgi:hydroxymethylpyrimidine/phosphomethylpyrimidine kinase
MIKELLYVIEMEESKIIKPIVLTIAGSDSSGGAGIQADLKAFAITGVHGASVITCLTAQNTKGVQKIHPVDIEMIEAQIDSVLSDLKPVVIKTGMLYSPEIIDLVVNKLEKYCRSINGKQKNDSDNYPRIVVDPVLIATTGASLTSENEVKQFNESLISRLFPIATLITPNLKEASELLGWDVQNLEDMKKACKELMKFGSKYVLLKGGHRTTITSKPEMNDQAVDLFYDGSNSIPHIFSAPMLDKDVHGTGCSFASLITGNIASGYNMIDAIDHAKQTITSGIASALTIGDGIEVIDTISPIYYELIRTQIYSEINNAVSELLEILKPQIIPEVGINIGYALPDADSSGDICALTGRLVRVGTGVGQLGKPEFGASKHIARIILTAIKFDKNIRSAMNIKYRPDLIKHCKKLGLSIGTFSRKSEPKEVSSMEWGSKIAIETLGFVPDLIYDVGGIGKEPMIRILGRQPNEVIGKLKKIMEHMDQK